MTVYYNENDPRAAAWLRQLIADGHLPEGRVDTRDIREVRADDVAGFDEVHLFAGIGGWPLALRLAGWPPDAPVWTGSCPCQPYSSAGKGLGDDDPRNLWPEFRRLAGECRPATIVGEQVASAAGRGWLAGVRSDLEAMGYAVGAADLGAAAVGAPHLRQRLYWVADDQEQRRGQGHPDERGGYRGIRAEGDRGGSPHDRGPRTVAVGHGERFSLGAEPDGREDRPGERPSRRADAGRRGRSRRLGNPFGFDARRDGGAGPCAEAQGPRPREEAGRLSHDPGPSGGDGFWSRAELIPCRDGKVRRAEPGIFPLADGVSGRVGLLRGYGNAIVPQVAAEFVAAFLEAREGGVSCP